MKKKLLSGLITCACASTSYSQITINEIDADTPGVDMLEFIELYDGGIGGTSLDGLVLVLVNGSDDLSYASFDLDGFTTDANGYFVIGSVPGANTTFNDSTNELQNGAEAVALYTGDAIDFPNDTAVTTTNLVDAVVYGVDDANDTELLAIFGGTQPDEDENSDSANESIQRNPDGAAAFIVSTPTPGSSNDQDPLLELSLTPSSINEGDGTGAIFAEVIVLNPVSGDLILSIAISDGTVLSGPTSVTIPDGSDFTFFELNAVDDAIVDGVQSVDVTVSSAGFQDGVVSVNVADNDLVLPEVVINEMQVKASGDDPQFVELYNDGPGSVDLAGWSVRVFESDSGNAAFGDEIGSFTIPSDSPVLLGSEEFYLVGNSVFETVYGIVPDLQTEPDFSIFDITMILFDADGNAVYTVFSTDGDEENQANNAGGAAVADVSIGPDGVNSPAGFILDEDGGSSASILNFSTFPADLATPGFSNVDFISRLRVEIDSTLLEEDAGIGAAMATITRINGIDGALSVNVVSSDTSEITVQAATILFADGEEVQSVALDVVDDAIEDGIQDVTVTASATGFVDGSNMVSVSDNDAPIANLVINEMIIDTPGADTEFVEIYNAGDVAVDLAGYSIEKWESDNGSAPGQDGGGSIFIPSASPVIISAGGYYLIANAAFQTAYPTVSIDLITPAAISFENSSATIVLRDANANVVHTVFATDGGAGDAANINGVLITPDAIGNDIAFALLPDGNSGNVVAISNAVPSPDATPGVSNGSSAVYEVTIADCFLSAGEFVINFTATGSSDIYVTTDLENFELATDGAGVASGTYSDSSPLATRAFYLIQEAGTPAP